jgi:fibro-slime domain-containing protein
MKPRRPGNASPALVIGLLSSLLACNTNPAIVGDGTGGNGAGGSHVDTGGSGGHPDIMPPPNGGAGGTAAAGGSGGGGPSPAEFSHVERGGFKLGDPLTSGTSEPGLGGGDKGCNLIVGVVRDFRGANLMGGHPDFEVFGGKAATPGLLADTLGPDRKPVYASVCQQGTMFSPAACPFGAETTTKDNFDQWYRNTDGVNKPYLIYFMFDEMSGIATFQSDHFFPMDGAGWDMPAVPPHNFNFTTELHTKFKYVGNESFTFDGDDDLWVFVNNKLALDLGGLHISVVGSINLDQMAAKLNIQPGNIYPMDLFHAERHSTQSHFRVDTNFAFVDCGQIIQ